MAKHWVRWETIDIDFKSDADMAALLEAVAVPEDVEDNSPELPDGLERRFLAWGWGCNTDLRTSGRVRTIGIYGDYTFIEEDERFMLAIAPFVLLGSYGVFDVSKTDVDERSSGEFWDHYEMWQFDGLGGVIRRKAHKRVEWD